MTKKLSIFRGRMSIKFYNGLIRTFRRRNPSLKCGPRHRRKTSNSNRRKFLDSKPK